jgi:plastocyanin
VIIIAGFIILGQRKPAGNTTTTSSNQNNTVQNIPANTIIINNFAFQPSSLTVKSGTTVTWENQDSVGHSIKSTSFNSQILQTGDKFQFTFNTKGTFNYNCGIHPSMTGIIVVE